MSRQQSEAWCCHRVLAQLFPLLMPSFSRSYLILQAQLCSAELASFLGEVKWL